MLNYPYLYNTDVFISNFQYKIILSDTTECITFSWIWSDWLFDLWLCKSPVYFNSQISASSIFSDHLI